MFQMVRLFVQLVELLGIKPEDVQVVDGLHYVGKAGRCLRAMSPNRGMTLHPDLKEIHLWWGDGYSVKLRPGKPVIVDMVVDDGDIDGCPVFDHMPIAEFRKGLAGAPGGAHWDLIAGVETMKDPSTDAEMAEQMAAEVASVEEWMQMLRS